MCGFANPDRYRRAGPRRAVGSLRHLSTRPRDPHRDRVGRRRYLRQGLRLRARSWCLRRRWTVPAFAACGGMLRYLLDRAAKTVDASVMGFLTQLSQLRGNATEYPL